MPAVGVKFGSSDTPPPLSPSSSTTAPLPGVLRTPGGLALVEIQGTINAPGSPSGEASQHPSQQGDVMSVSVGRLEFPLHRPDTDSSGDQGWMKQVHFYVGHHQRLTGEVKKLSKPLVVLSRRAERETEGGAGTGHHATRVGHDGEVESPSTREELEVLEVIRYKLLFAGRPEPVGGR